MLPRPSTIREVAKRASVSVSTVSRVLNDYPYVSEETRRRVLEAVRELDYLPDFVARSMRTGTTRAVGFVVADISNPSFAAVAKGVDAVLDPGGYALVLAHSENDPEREAGMLTVLRQRRLDGLVAAVADERAPGLAARLDGFTCVLFDRDVPGSNADAVISDHAAGMGEALTRLVALGHRRVALVAGSAGQLGSRARMIGFRSHARRLGLPASDRLVISLEPGRATGARVARELLALAEPPTAIITGHNQLTVGVLEALQELGVRVPDELSIVACDDIAATRLYAPPIDVIERDLPELGRIIGRLLLERFAGHDGPPKRLVLPTRLLVRGSTGRPCVTEGVPGA